MKLTFISPESLVLSLFQVHSFQFMCEDSRGVPLSPLSPRSPFWPVGPWIPVSPFAPFFPSAPGVPRAAQVSVGSVHHDQVPQKIPAFHAYQVVHLSRVDLHKDMEQTALDIVWTLSLVEITCQKFVQDFLRFNFLLSVLFNFI